MKKLSIILFLCVVVSTAWSQHFMHGVGFSVLGGNISKRNNDIFLNEGITYSPRINFIERKNLSLSVGMPFTIGITGTYNNSYNTSYGNTTTNTLGLLLNVPLIVNFNLGCGASKQTQKRIGYFVGAGGAYHYGTFKENLYGFYGDPVQFISKVSSFGLTANAGFRFAVGRKTRNIEVRFSYMKSLDDTGVKVYGLGAAFNF